MNHPCRACGACCASLLVAFDALELARHGGPVPDQHAQIAEGKAVMRGTLDSPRRCQALEGTVGEWTTCTMHASRPSTCRLFPPSYETGLRNPKCDLAREAHGLQPLTPDLWERHRAHLDHPVIETPRRLSASRIWQLQRDFFTLLGPQAWTQAIVPYGVSTNAAVAQAYARVLAAFAQDTGAGPLTILDLGSGSGRLAYLLAMALLREGLVDFCVVASDFDEANLRAMERHPAMQPLLEAGRLDLAHFDLQGLGPVRTRRGGVALQGLDRLVVVANYVFDGVPTDAWELQAGQATEIHYGITRNPDRRLDPARLERYTLVPAPSPAQPYGDPLLDGLIATYQHNLTDAGIWLPTAALACLRHLATLADRVLVLVGDKGLRSLEELDHRHIRGVTTHGSVSLTVNLHALEVLARSLGGSALHGVTGDAVYVTSLFTLGVHAEALPHTQAAYLAMDAADPREALRAAGLVDATTLSADEALALIERCACDPWAFAALFHRVVPALGDAALHPRCRAVLERVAANDYPLGRGGYATCLWLGAGWLELGEPERADTWLVQSLQRDGQRAQTWFLLARCRAGQAGEEALKRARAIDPKH